MEINLVALHQEVSALLRESELRTAELRGQLAMILRLDALAQSPIITHGEDAPDLSQHTMDAERAATNGHTQHTGPLV